MHKRLLALLLLLTPLATLSAAEPPPTTAGSPFPILLVRVVELSATGPDEGSHILYRSSEGFVTRLRELGRVGYQVSGEGLADGHYHTLYVLLDDEYQEIDKDGVTRQRRFSEEGKASRMRTRGMVLVEGGEATPHGMLESPSHYLPPRGRGDDDD